MSSSGSDFSTRIVPILRPALMTKLGEMFGQKVTQDLPDYIIVMLSNKKSKDYIHRQVIDIIGEKRSTSFVDWLFVKLEQIESGKSEKQAGPSEVVKPKQEEPKPSQRTQKTSESQGQRRPSESSRDERRTTSRTQETDRRRRDDRSRERDHDRREKRHGRDRRELERRDPYGHRDRDHHPRCRSRSAERRREERMDSPSPPREQTPPKPKVPSSVVVKRRVPDSRAAKGGSSIFMRAMNAATTKDKASPRKRRIEAEEESMEVEERKRVVPQKRSALFSRLTGRQVDSSGGQFTITVGNRSSGPSVRILSAEESGDSANVIRVGATRRIAEIKRIVSGAANKSPSKARIAREERFGMTMERKPLNERLSKIDGSRCVLGGVGSEKNGSSDSTPTSGQKWNYQIQLSDNETESEDEAMIDAMVADGNPSPPSQAEDHMQPEERAFFKQTAKNIHFNPAHPKFAKTGEAAQDQGQVSAPAFPPAHRIQTRCKFYPNCMLPDGQCPYLHPTVPCSKFPHCRFGERCMYQHPLCRYGKLCQNAYCSYTHPAKTSNLTYFAAKNVAGAKPGVAAAT
ncbi:hypothetical protein L596_011610 [Steinernema carpocapsae]|uniref:Zinc finger CCCH domain-containing protein 14 n=1 Tax=Steinernema carpocapsae TaxID=34508 RepID=A0A4U5NUW5_STECR|nr:hypothetical protein L596_011610 [Steinernema carpocapsae]